MSQSQSQDFQLLQLLIRYNGAQTDLEKVNASKDLFDFIQENMEIINTPELYEITRSTAEQILDHIDHLLFFSDIDKTILMDTQQSVSSFYYYDDIFNEELENDYLNTYLED